MRQYIVTVRDDSDSKVINCHKLEAHSKREAIACVKYYTEQTHVYDGFIYKAQRYKGDKKHD